MFDPDHIRTAPALFSLLATLRNTAAAELLERPVSRADLLKHEQTQGFAIDPALHQALLQHGCIYWEQDMQVGEDSQLLICAVYANDAENSRNCSLYHFLSYALRASNALDNFDLTPYRAVLRFNYYCYGYLNYYHQEQHHLRFFYQDSQGRLGCLDLVDTFTFDPANALAALETEAAHSFATARKQALRETVAAAGKAEFLQKTPSLLALVDDIFQQQPAALNMHAATEYKLEQIEDIVGFAVPPEILAFWRQHGAVNLQQEYSSAAGAKLAGCRFSSRIFFCFSMICIYTIS